MLHDGFVEQRFHNYMILKVLIIFYLKLNLFKSDVYIFMQQSLLNSVNFREHYPLSFQFPVNVQNNLENQWPAFLMDLLPQGYGRKELLNQLGCFN